MKKLQGLVFRMAVSWASIFSISSLIALSLMSSAYAGDTLRQDERLSRDQSLTSNNGCFRLIMQNDGNLVLYNKADTPLWATGTTGKEVNFAIMQADGNFVLYGPDGHPVWAANPENVGPAGFRLVVQDDGNTVVYANDRPTWVTNTGGIGCTVTNNPKANNVDTLPPQTSGKVQGSKPRISMGGGWAEATATFYRNGLLVVDGHTVSDSKTSGTYAYVYVVGLDEKGRSLFVSKSFDMPTACSRWDTCSHDRRANFQQQINSDLAKYVAEIDVYVADRSSGRSGREVVATTIRETCATYDDLPAAARAGIAAETGFAGCGPR